MRVFSKPGERFVLGSEVKNQEDMVAFLLERGYREGNDALVSTGNGPDADVHSSSSVAVVESQAVGEV
jgi:hypothetical protein